MVDRTAQTTTIFCDQCGLPFTHSVKGKGGVTQTLGDKEFRFCCYGCSFTHSLTGEKGEGGVASLFLIRLAFAAFFSMNIMILSWVLYADRWKWLGIEPSVLPALNMLLFVLSTPIVLLAGYPFFRNALGELRRLRLSMDSLIALGSVAAYGFSTYEVFTGGSGLYFDTGTMVLVLVTAGRYLEATAKIRTSTAIHGLLELRPRRARVLREGVEIDVASAEVGVGETIRIRPGERIPLDGTVVDGISTVNESFLTGESVPALKESGSRIFAATINVDGLLTAKTTGIEEDTVHAQLVRLMEEAQRTRSPIHQLVDRISFVFIPGVIAVAAGTFAVWFVTAGTAPALLNSLTVLVVSCPCALGIGTPLATSLAIARAAEEGVLIRSTAALEKLSAIDTVLCDKTGTVTSGVPSVVSVEASDATEEELLIVAASLEAHSEHSFGKAIVSHAALKGLRLFETRNVAANPGKGIRGDVRLTQGWCAVAVGTQRFLAEIGFSSEVMNELRGMGRFSTVFIAWDGKVHGAIGLSDSLRTDAVVTCADLAGRGIHVGLLSGDAQEVVDSVGRLLKASTMRGSLLPEQKVGYVKEMIASGRRVLMVGDGINDAPALSSADIGVAMGSGTDLAKESADVTLIGTQLSRIPWLLDLGRKTYSIIKWNLFWAFIYNFIGILLAALGLLDPIVAALAMIVSSVFIIVNSRRVRISSPHSHLKTV